jgi:hypothetical protein
MPLVFTSKITNSCRSYVTRQIAQSYVGHTTRQTSSMSPSSGACSRWHGRGNGCKRHILMHSLCLTLIRYMVLTQNLTASKSADHISCVSNLPAHAQISHISFTFTTTVQGRSSSMSIHLWPCTTHSIPTSLFGPSWGCAGGLSLRNIHFLLSIKANLFVIGVARVYFNSYHINMVPGQEGRRSAGRLCSGLGAT